MDENYAQAKKRMHQLKAFYNNLISYIIVMIFLVVINYFTSPNFWWVIFPALIWGIFVVIQGVSVYSKRGLFSKEWEDKKIQEYMDDKEE
jgi:surface polysaccharide O-acyltransferase-like enzyme